MKFADLDWMEKDYWALIATGEGASSLVTTGKFLPQAIHDLMCCCGRDVDICKDSSVLEILTEMKDSDEWGYDEVNKPFQYSWSHECGEVTVTRIDEIRHPA